MNATTYSPIASAISELTSSRAQQYYVHKAQRDIQTTLDAALTVYCMAAAVAQFLIDFYAEYNAAALPTISTVLMVEPLPALPSFAPVALLMPAADDDEPELPASFMAYLYCAPVDQQAINQQWITKQMASAIFQQTLWASPSEPAPKAKAKRKPRAKK